ncbi:ribonuclease P protein component [soil metagenome]
MLNPLLVDKTFTRKDKMLSSKAFLRVFKSSRKIHVRGFAIQASANDLGYPRLGMVIAKKNLAKAVARNKVKRLIREGFRIRKNQIAARDVIIFTTKEVSSLTKADLDACLNNLWDKISLR